MKRPLVAALFAALLSQVIGAMLPSRLLAQAEPTPEKVLEVWRNRQERVHSGRFAFAESVSSIAGTLPGKATSFQHRLIEPTDEPPRAQYGPAKDAIHEIKRTMCFDGDRMRYSIEGPQWVPAVEEFLPRLYVRVFDGSVEKSFHGQAGEKVFPLGFVDSQARQNADAGTRYLHPVFMNYRPFHPTTGRFKREGWTVAGKGIVDGRDCVILENDTGSWKRSCWVDPEREYVILRYTNQTSQGGKDVYRLDISYQRDTAHGWVPARWKAVSVFPETSKIEESYTAVMTDYAINVPIEPSEFQFEFPSGTAVRHYQEDSMYILRDGEKRTITSDELERGATYEEMLTTPSGMAGIRPRNWFRLLLIGATCISVLLLLALWRRKASAS